MRWDDQTDTRVHLLRCEDPWIQGIYQQLKRACGHFEKGQTRASTNAARQQPSLLHPGSLGRKNATKGIRDLWTTWKPCWASPDCRCSSFPLNIIQHSAVSRSPAFHLWSPCVSHASRASSAIHPVSHRLWRIRFLYWPFSSRICARLKRWLHIWLLRLLFCVIVRDPHEMIPTDSHGIQFATSPYSTWH